MTTQAQPAARPTKNGRILIVDDERDQCELMQLALTRLGFECEFLTSALDAIDRVGKEDFDVVLTDLGMSEMSGLELCERLLGIRRDLLVVVVTGQSNMETVVAAMRTGAYDFLVKPFDVKLLGLSVARAVKHRQLQDEVKRLRAARPSGERNGLVGESRAMLRLHDLIDRIGPNDTSVLITGESGTGKELVARAIHDASPRRNRAFVAINCAAVPATLIESELFGHAKGAFTDAKNQREGLFVQASGGTLFLDEIGEMPIEMQPKLLRALQERVVRPVGANQEVAFDVRIIAATNRDLETEVYEKRFREDLYYRINVVSLALPPLRERSADVLILAKAFLDRYGTRMNKPQLAIPHAVAEKLLAYSWPGNVRELENCIERMVTLARFEEVTVEDLPERVRTYRSDRFVLAADHTEEVLNLDELEKRYIDRVLKLVDGNKTRAAQLLGLDRRTLYRKLGRYDAEADASGRTGP